MKVLIVGLGSIAKRHIEAIRLLDSNIDIFVLRSSTNSVPFDGVKNIYSFDEFEGIPDFVIISNPTYLHHQTILDVLHFKCPLFIEKPVISNLDFSNELLKKIDHLGIINYVACNMRFHPSIQFIKAYLFQHDPRINEVNIYCGSYLPDWRPGVNYKDVYSAKNEMGGGVHLDLIHELDYCTWIFGFPLRKKARFSSISSLEIGSTDNACYWFEYSTYNINVTLNYYRRDAKRCIEIITDRETIVVDLLKNKVTSSILGDLFSAEEFNIFETYFSQIKYFINQIKLGNKTMNDINKGIKVLKLAINE